VQEVKRAAEVFREIRNRSGVGWKW